MVTRPGEFFFSIVPFLQYLTPGIELSQGQKLVNFLFLTLSENFPCPVFILYPLTTGGGEKKK